MLLQVTLRILIVAIIVISVQSKRFQTKFCAECEEEVWEEVPCDAIYASSSTTASTPVTYSPPTTTPLPSTTATPPPTPTTISTSTSTPAPIPSSPLYPTPPTASPSIYATMQNLTELQVEANPNYKKCYCECKSGCREFCRKIVLHPDTNKQILQLSRTIQPQPNGHIEIKHLQERNFVPSSAQYHSNNLDLSPQQLPSLPYAEHKVAYNVAPTPAPAYSPPQINGNYQPPYEENSLGFSIEEFANLLNSDHEYSNLIPKISPINYPQLNHPALPNPPAQLPYYPPSASPPQISYPPLPLSSVDSQASIYSANSAHVSANSIPRPLQSNYPLPPSYPSPAYLPQLPYAPGQLSSVDAQTAISGGGSAAAIAITPDNYKSSRAPNSNQGYSDPPPNVRPVLLNPNPIISQKYRSTSSSLNSLQNIEPAIQSYLNDFFYSNPPRTRGYGYPL